MSKNIKKFLKFLVAGLMGLLMFCAAEPVMTEASELYFDQEGNLYFHTRDRRAFGNVSYMTLGWIIKRYNMPMDAPGQEYVIVTKVNYKPDEIDPTDSNYVLSYFKSDKNEILDAVKSRSMEWYEQLYLYGDKVYIDSVMTVCNKGVPLGTLYKGGAYTGEVYFTYDTFVVARGWSSPHIIKTHYDMVVVFPQLKKSYDVSYEVKDTKECSFRTTALQSFTMGHSAYGSEIYNLKGGVPSGEKLYLKGALDEAIYVLTVDEVTATITQTISVPCVYNLVWKDYNGVAQAEERTIYRYYDVSKDYTYYRYKNLDIYSLSWVGLSGDILDEGIDIDVHMPAARVSVQPYSGPADYMYYCVRENISPIDCGTLTGTINGVKPSIPDVDYSQVAESSINSIVVRNDRVTVDGVQVLGKSVHAGSPESPTLDEAVEYVNIYREDITIPKLTVNGYYRDTAVSCTYINEDGEELIYRDIGIGNILVHTPVYCQGEVSLQIDIEKDDAPMVDEMNMRKTLTLAFIEQGQHRPVVGYGYRSYGEYVEARCVICTFPVVYKGVRYEANQRIMVDETTVQLTVCEDVPEGQYAIFLESWAYNAAELSEYALERRANLSWSRYGAWDMVYVQLKGKSQVDYEISGTH